MHNDARVGHRGISIIRMQLWRAACLYIAIIQLFELTASAEKIKLGASAYHGSKIQQLSQGFDFSTASLTAISKQFPFEG